MFTNICHQQCWSSVQRFARTTHTSTHTLGVDKSDSLLTLEICAHSHCLSRCVWCRSIDHQKLAARCSQRCVGDNMSVQHIPLDTETTTVKQHKSKERACEDPLQVDSRFQMESAFRCRRTQTLILFPMLAIWEIAPSPPGHASSRETAPKAMGCAETT